MKWLKITILNTTASSLMGAVMNLILSIAKSHPGEVSLTLAPFILFVLLMGVTCYASAIMPVTFGGGIAMDWEVKLSMAIWGVTSILCVVPQIFLVLG